MAASKTPKCSVCTHPLQQQIDQMLGKDEDYKDIRAMVKAAGTPDLSMAALSRHFKQHYVPANKTALVWRNGKICFEDGTAVTAISPIDFLENVVSVVGHNIVRNPHKLGVRDALIAIELLLKIRDNLDKEDDFNQAWRDFLTTGKFNQKRKKTKKVTVEVEETVEDGLPEVIVVRPDQPALDSPTEIESYEDWPEGEDDGDGEEE